MDFRRVLAVEYKPPFGIDVVFDDISNEEEIARWLELEDVDEHKSHRAIHL